MSDEEMVRALMDIAQALNRIELELKSLNSLLSDYFSGATTFRPVGEPEPGAKRNGKVFRGSREDFEKQLREIDKQVWALIEDIKEMPSGDLLVVFDYLSSNEYEHVRQVLKEHFGAYYSKRYRGFIVPREGVAE